MPAGAHCKVDALEPHRLERPAELGSVHARQMFRKKAERPGEAGLAPFNALMRAEGRLPEDLRRWQRHARRLNKTAPAHSFHGCIVTEVGGPGLVLSTHAGSWFADPAGLST